MGGEEGTSRGVATEPQPQPVPPQYHYGTFQGVANYPPPAQPVMGFPQPIPPPASHGHPQHHHHHYYSHGYQTVPGYAVIDGRPVRRHRLPCCGIGIGWFLFIIGFFLGAIPWYIGAFIVLCVRVDYREKPGLITCTIAAILAFVAVTLGVTKANNTW